jgi:hypothetical protein
MQQITVREHFYSDDLGAFVKKTFTVKKQGRLGTIAPGTTGQGAFDKLTILEGKRCWSNGIKNNSALNKSTLYRSAHRG